MFSQGQVFFRFTNFMSSVWLALLYFFVALSCQGHSLIVLYDCLFRTRKMEKQGFEEKEELKSKLESTMEEKFKLEKVRKYIFNLFIEGCYSDHVYFVFN